MLTMFPCQFIKSIRYMQFLCAFIGALSFACSSTHLLWPSPSLPKLMSEDSPIGVRITSEEVSWIPSATLVGVVCTACIKIACAELIGRRTWMLLSGVFLTVPWIIIYISKSFTLLCIARFIGGIGPGIVITTVPVYIAEITEKDIRGKLMATIGILQLSGYLFVFVFGPLLSYTNFALACGIIPILFLALMYITPESPYYLVMVGKTKEASNVLKRLSSNHADGEFLTNRLKEIEESATRAMKNKTNIWECIWNRKYRRTVLIGIGSKTLQQLCGIAAVESYAQTIITNVDSSISPEMSSILFGLIQIPAAILFYLLVDKVGRRPLWILSASGCFISLFVLGTYFYSNVMKSFNWLPTSCIVLFILMVHLGVYPLPFILLAEIFATNIKSVAISLTVVYSSILSLAVISSFEHIAIHFGMHVVFWIFASICLLGVCFVIFIIPETKGKTLEDIQQMFNKKESINTFQEDRL